MSSAVFQKIVDSLCIASLEPKYRTISWDEYYDFDKHYLLDAIRDIPYGVAFCKRFDIVDSVLFTVKDWDFCVNHIKMFYVK